MRWLVICFLLGCGGKQGGAAAPGDDISKCEAGDGEACTKLGAANEPNVRGEGGNAPLAFAYYKKACAAKSWKGCTGLGKLYHRGIGTPRDLVAAAKHYELACTNSYAHGCWSRARMYHNWLRGCDPAMNDENYKRPRDCKGHVLETSKKAVELLRKACNLDKQSGGCEIVSAYDEKPGIVSIKHDDDFREDWHFADPSEPEPVWDDHEQK